MACHALGAASKGCHRLTVVLCTWTQCRRSSACRLPHGPGMWRLHHCRVVSRWLTSYSSAVQCLCRRYVLSLVNSRAPTVAGDRVGSLWAWCRIGAEGNRAMGAGVMRLPWSLGDFIRACFTCVPPAPSSLEHSPSCPMHYCWSLAAALGHLFVVMFTSGSVPGWWHCLSLSGHVTLFIAWCQLRL